MAHLHTRAVGRLVLTSWKASGLSVALAAAAHLGCQDVVKGSGRVIEEERPVTGFNALRLETEGDIRWVQAEPERLAIEAEDNMVAELRTEVADGKLVIRTRSNVDLEPTRPIVYRLTAPDLDSIEIDGSGSVSAAGVDTDRLELSIDGSGDIAIDGLSLSSLRTILDGSGQVTVKELQADRVESSIDGSGDIALSGVVNTQRVDVDGSGDYDALALQARTAEAGVDGSGDVSVYVTDELTVQISGSGDVLVKGPARVSSRVDGSGTVRQVGSSEAPRGSTPPETLGSANPQP
jgi:hypothetical protein